MSNANTLQLRIEVVDQGSKKIKDLGDSVRRVGNDAETGFSKAGRSLGDFDSKAARLGATMRAAVAGVGALMAALAVRELVQIADQYTLIEGRIKLVTSSSAEATAVQRELYQVAQRSRAEFTSTADVYSRFAQATKGTSMSQRELLAMTETLNKAFVISGASNAEAQAAMVQLSQGFSAGVLRGEEFNSVMESGGRIVDMLTDYLGVNRGELRAMAQEGKLTADVLRNAIAAGAATVNAEFDRMPMTVGQAITGLKNASGAVVDWANDTTGATSGIAVSIQWVTGVIEEIPAFVAWASGEAIIAWDNFIRHWEVAAVTMKSVIFVAFDEITETVANGIANIYTALERLPFVELDGDAQGFVQRLRDLSSASEDYHVQVERINREHDVTVASYRQTQAQMTARKAGLESVTAATGDAAVAVGELNTETEKNGKAATTAADAWQRYQVQMTRADGWLLRDQGMVKANERAEEMIQTLSELDALVSDDAFFELAATIEAETKTATDTSQTLWQDFVSNTGDIIHDFVNRVVKGEFDSVGELFGGLLDSMLSMLLDFLAKAAANSLIEAIFGSGASGSSLTLGSLLGGLSGGGSGSESGSGGYSLPSGGLGDGAKAWIAENVSEQAASYFSTAAGAVGVAGGAYGMYSGIKDMSDGNLGQGAVKTGLGAYSTYKGAVTLGLIEEGTATKLGQSIAQGISSYVGASSSAYSAGGAMMHVGGSVAEGGALAAGGASSAGGSAGGAAAGGLSASGAAVGGIYALAAYIIAGMAIGKNYSPAQQQRDSLNQTNTTPGSLNMAGVTDQLRLFSDTLDRDMAPALDKAAVGSYNAGSQMLVLGRATQEWVSTGVEGQGQLVDAMVYDTWRWDNLKNAWVTVNSPIDGLVDKLHRLKPTTDAAAAATAQMLATQAGYPDLADEVLAAYQDQVAGIQQLGGESERFTGLLGSNRMALSNASAAAAEMSGSMDSVASTGVAAGDRLGHLRNGLFGVSGAADQVVSGINAHKAATDSLAAASVGAASRIGAAAGEVGSAVSRIGGLLGRAASFSDPRFQGNAAGAIYSYHALGGVMTRPTVFHIGGEAGDEAILPLHAGPDTVRKMDAKLDRIIAGGADNEMKALMAANVAWSKKIADALRRIEYVGIPESQRKAVAA